MGTTDLKILYERDTFDLHEGANIIGRKDADITIPVSSLSKEHAKIIRVGSRLEIEDAGSKNGTMLNDEPVQGRMLLEQGDVIVLGGKVQLHVVSGDQPAPPPVSGKLALGGKIPLDDSKRSADAPPKRTIADSEPGAPPPPKARFTIIQGDGKGKVVAVAADKQFTLGSKEENGIPLKGEGISRYHAEVVFEKGVWLLKDLGSRNGTLVRERKVDLHELVSGDVVQIGSVHLRFEVEETKSNAAAVDARALVALLKEDPKAALKSPHIRRAGMLVVGAACLAFLAFKNGKQPPALEPDKAPTAEVQATIHQTIEQLKKDDAARADAAIGKAIRALGPYKQNQTLNNLEKLVKKWLDHSSPLSFEWTEAVAAIDVVIRGSAPSEMDQDCLDWLEKARVDTQSEIPNAELRKQADIVFSRGQNGLRAGKREASDELREARELYQKMPPTSVFAKLARERATDIRKLLLEYFKREAEARITGDKPRWEEAQKLFAEARKFTETLDERRPIDERSGYCEINRRDEETLIEVVKIVQANDEQNYGKAKELLESIGEKSFCYRGALAYKSWFKADSLARQAITAYHGGQLDNATRLLNDALKLPDLEPIVIQSGKSLLDRWTKVEENWRKGYACEQKGDLATAKDHYRTVIESEPVKDNVYRQRAEKQLALLENREQDDLDTALKHGIDLLDQGKCADAYEKFCFVLERAQNPGPPRNQIEDAVARVNAEKGLYKEANRIFTSGKKDKFPYVRDVLQLLGRFLPEKNPDRENAIQLLPKVKG